MAAGQQMVQDYLQKHKIGSLFEELMAKIINDMPEEPIPYLIRNLQRRADRLNTSHLRKSTGDLAGRTRAGSPEAVRRSMPGAAAAWANSGDGFAVAKEKIYDKPWMTNTKRLKPKTEGRKGEKPEWDSSKKSPPTFDDIWESGKTKKSTGQRRERSPTRKTGPRSAWADAEEDDQGFESFGYRGPRRHYVSSEDALAGELPVAKAEKRSKFTPVSSGGRYKGYKADAMKHKKALGKLIQEQQSRRDSGFEDDRDLDNQDDATELLENADDLRSEGVTKVRGSGFKVSKSSRPKTRVEAQVKVSICARCARVMSGEPSEPAVGTQFGELPDYSYDTARDPDSRPQSARISPGPSDDEFESVSQVTGPRHPVWQDSDAEVAAQTPRKGEHMFAAHGAPSKGRPMYSPDFPDMQGAREKGPERSTLKSDDFEHRTSPQKSKDVTFSDQDALRQTWSPGYQGDVESEAGKSKAESLAETEGKQEEDAETTSPSVLARGGRGWATPDYDTDTSDVNWPSKPGMGVSSDTKGHKS